MGRSSIPLRIAVYNEYLPIRISEYRYIFVVKAHGYLLLRCQYFCIHMSYIMFSIIVYCIYNK